MSSWQRYFQEEPADWGEISEDPEEDMPIFYYDLETKAAEDEPRKYPEIDLMWLRITFGKLVFILVCSKTQGLYDVWYRIIEILYLADFQLDLENFVFRKDNGKIIRYWDVFIEHFDESNKFVLRVNMAQKF